MKWTKIQFWDVAMRLCQSDKVSYDEVLFSPLFKGNDEALQAMAKADLISLVNSRRYGKQIRASKPLYRASFRRLRDDKILAGGMGR